MEVSYVAAGKYGWRYAKLPQQMVLLYQPSNRGFHAVSSNLRFHSRGSLSDKRGSLFMIFFWNPPAKKTEPAPFKVHIKRLDPLGTFFFVPAVVCLLLALQWGGATYAWANWRIILLFVLCGVLALAFAAVQILMPDTASIPPRIIKQRSVLFAVCFTFFIAGSMLMLVYYLPIWCKCCLLVSRSFTGLLIQV